MEERPPYLAGPKREKLIAIRMTKTTLFLTESELSRLLVKDPELWAAAIKRGKAIRRKAKTRPPKTGGTI